MIGRAKISDITDILNITKACTSLMIENGIYQWNIDYPSRIHFENDIKREELYILLWENTIIGTIAISSLIDKEYETVKWLTNNNNNLYIHRLCIHPEYQGNRNAQKLMLFPENYAKNNNIISIRLDTFNRNQKFYETRGYQKLGDIFFPNQSKHPFYCYELVL